AIEGLPPGLPGGQPAREQIEERAEKPTLEAHPVLGLDPGDVPSLQAIGIELAVRPRLDDSRPIGPQISVQRTPIGPRERVTAPVGHASSPALRISGTTAGGPPPRTP